MGFFDTHKKFVAVILGNVLAIALGWLAVNVPSVATCDAANACSFLGLGQGELTASLMFLLSALFVERGPANK